MVHAKNYETVSTLFCQSYAEKTVASFFPDTM